MKSAPKSGVALPAASSRVGVSSEMVVDDNIPSSNPRSRPTVTGETPKTTTTPKQQNKETPKTELNDEKVEKLANSSNQQRNRAGPGTSSATDQGDEKPRPEVNETAHLSSLI